MRRVLAVAVAALCVCGCSIQIEVQSDTTWKGVVNHADVSGSGYATYDLWSNSPGFYFRKQTERGYLSVRFKQGRGDEPETTAPYGAIWGSAW